MAVAAGGLVVGIDTHLDVHVAAVLGQLGRRLAVRDFPATDAGNAQLARWLDSLGTVTDASRTASPVPEVGTLCLASRSLPGGAIADRSGDGLRNRPQIRTVFCVLRLLIDTSTWLDLAARRDGQKWIVPLRVLLHQGKLILLVLPLGIEEFERSRARSEAAVTANVLARLRQLRRELNEFAGEKHEHAHRPSGFLRRRVCGEYEEVEFLISEEEPRTLAEIVEATEEFFERAWYVRSIAHADTEALVMMRHGSTATSAGS